ncbi:MAG: c-type cytochrome biogenesis protein CcmI [Proteobacteria bacterium]|nr:c-type cytochrome biogenesis protein CcmI [Pseudomonadota bacterium]
MSASLLTFALVLGLTAAGLLLPMLLWRSSRTLSRAAGASAVLRDKLTQVARDRDAGLIGADEAIGAEAEISRALIAASRETEAEAAAGAPRSGGWVGIALIATLALGGSIGIYRINGSFELPDQPLATREIAPEGAVPTLLSEHDGSVVDEAILSLRARLETDPDNADHWRLLARSYAAVGAHKQAAAAYARLIELAPEAMELRGDYAETLIRAEDGFVGPRAVASFETVLGRLPDDPRALYYLALRDAQSGDELKAAQGWVRLLRTAPDDASYIAAIHEILDTVIAETGLERAALDIPARPEPGLPPGPSAADVAAVAALPEDQQLEMIRGMVDRLEARLGEEPGDIEGWLRLASSRAVLGEPEQAVAALERALAENPGDADLQSALIDLRDAAR